MSTDGSSSPHPGEAPRPEPDPWGAPAAPPPAPSAHPSAGYPTGPGHPIGAGYPTGPGYPTGTSAPPPAGQQPPQGYPTPPAYPMGPVGYGVPTLPKEAYASWWHRVRAFLIDQLPTYVGLIVFYIGYGIGLARFSSMVNSGSYSSSVGPLELFLNPLVIIGWVLMLAGFGWNIWNRWLVGGKTGQSLGRRVLGVRLVSEQTGQPIGAGMAFLRDLVHILDGMACYIGYLWPLWDEKRQTFADKLLQTVVLPAPTGASSTGQPPAPAAAPGGYPGAG